MKARSSLKPARKKNRIVARSRRQCAAIPIIEGPDGQLMVMLVTSRETSRWIVPKGWIPAKLTVAEAAAREAFEEAGVVGQITTSKPVGGYRYEKRPTQSRAVACAVDVFLLRVEQQLEVWPEKDQRQTRWFLPTEASELVDEPGLASILRSMPRFKPGKLIKSGKGEKQSQRLLLMFHDLGD